MSKLISTFAYMNGSFKFSPEKASIAVRLILQNLSSNTDFHKLFKILYFADQKHLVRYGRPISGDMYGAMNFGPVPSSIYDLLKALRGNEIFSNSIEQCFPAWAETVEVKAGWQVYLLKELSLEDLEELSESEMECLTESVTENKHLSFATLRDKSHDIAWEKVYDENSANRMSIIDIAKAGGASDEILKYVSINLENELI